MKKFAKTILTLSLAAIVASTAFVTPASAQTNVNKSVDDVSDADQDVLFILPSNNTDLTIGVTGKYQFRLTHIGLSKKAEDAGFEVVGDRTVKFEGKTYAINWFAESANASVTSNGLLSAKKLTSKEVKVSAVISESIFTNSIGEHFTFKDDIVATVNVTIVPEEDLQVYFLGVWKESKNDNDATHSLDYALNSANVEDQLKVLAEVTTPVHGSGKGTSYNVVAYTKTDNDLVRAYVTTYNKLAGNHYYILTFSTNDGVNNIVVHGRDYCDKNYTEAGEYFRDAQVTK